MKIRMFHTEIGDGFLNTDSQKNGKPPTFVNDAGEIFHPGDRFPLGRRYGYLHKIDGIQYTPEEIKWVHKYIVRSHLIIVAGEKWDFGATWKTKEQLEEIECLNGKDMIRNI